MCFVCRELRECTPCEQSVGSWMAAILKTVVQCFSNAGPRPGTGPWHQLYRAARGLRKLQYAIRFY